MSLGAFDLLKAAEVFDNLNEALHDVNYSFGTSCASQRDLQPICLTSINSQLEELREKVQKIAFVFGEERDGLSKEELGRCDASIRIPSDPSFASLNLAQAVGICAYELNKSRAQFGRWAAGNDSIENTDAINPPDAINHHDSMQKAEPADAAGAAAHKPCATRELDNTLFTTGKNDDEFFQLLDGLLHEIGFSRSFNRASTLSELRALYQRAKPNLREYGMLNGMLRKINSKLKTENC